MSMNENPGSGYVLPAADLVTVIPNALQGSFKAALDEGWEDVRDWIEAHWAKCQEVYPSLPDLDPNSVYRPADEDTVDGETMEHGVIYVMFDESDLFIKTPSAANLFMEKKSIKPRHSRWSVWA